ncbi:MAG: hypothetical protein K6E75_12825 [Lachnospiraceae bacterium]|nr:hypothetical protein [Lachnospiraceae bacterium]
MKKKLFLFMLIIIVSAVPVRAKSTEDIYKPVTETIEEDISSEGVPYEMDGKFVLPTTYNARSLGMTTSVKDQGDMPFCLTYARIAALETALIKSGYENSSVDLSEVHMLYERWIASGSKKSFGQWCKYSGTETLGLESSFDNSFQLRDFPVYESQMSMGSFSEDYIPDVSNIASSPYEIKKIYLYKQDTDAEQSEMIRATKEGIYRYGSVAANLSYVPDTEDDEAYRFWGNGQDYTYYLPEKVSSSVGHVIQIVGWDDEYPKDNFTIKPPANGAFLCKNSWGNVGGSSGYFWMSYYSKVRIIWEGFEVAMKGTTARGIEAENGEITLYAGQTSDHVKVKMIPETAVSEEWYIDIPANDEYLMVNADQSITCKKFQKPASNIGDPTVCIRTVKIKSKNKALNFSTQIQIKMLANTIKNEGMVYIPDIGKADISKGISVYPVSEQKTEIKYQGNSGVTIEEECMAKPVSYGQTSVRAGLDGQSVNIPCCVYCTGFELGGDIENNGSVNAVLNPKFRLDGNTDQLKDLIIYTSSDENVAKVEGQFIYFTGNGKALITGKLLDEKLTNGVELTDSFTVTVGGLEGGMEDMGESVSVPSYDPSYDQIQDYSVPIQTDPVIDTAMPDSVLVSCEVEIPKADISYQKKAGINEKAPGKVKILSKKVLSGGKVSLKWERVPSAKRYEIQISPNKSFSKAKSFYSKKEKKTIKGLADGGKYYIRIRAIGKRKYGKWSKKKSIRVDEY